MSRRDRHAQLRRIAAIDVTPLVDLTFLLLLVFIITAPAIEKAVDVSPPRFEGEAMPNEPVRIINLDKLGRVTLDHQVYSLQDLGGVLSQAVADKPDTQFYLRADEARPYGEVMGVMRVVRQAGVTKVSLVTESEDQG